MPSFDMPAIAESWACFSPRSWAETLPASSESDSAAAEAAETHATS